ncbi:MAG: DUF4349 domain-containing protein [Polyangiales bacterium]
MHSIHRRVARLAVALGGLALGTASGCASGSAASRATAAAEYGGYPGGYATSGVEEASGPPSAAVMYADAQPARAQGAMPQAVPVAPATTAPAVATDATAPSAGPMLVYTGTFHVAVYQVHESMDAMVAAARELGGFIATQGDDVLVFRVPAGRFDEAVAKIEQAGQVVHREVRAEDVGEEFRDVGIRIRNLEAMRLRVEAMLAQAANVEQALQVERELVRITEELERLKGRQRFLADRVAFATLTVVFRPRGNEAVGQEDVPSLPFPWLDRIGLGPLLQF